MHHKTICIYLFILLAISFSAQATHDCPPWLAKAILIKGKVDIQHFDDYIWKPINSNHTFCYGDKVRTAKNSRTLLILKDRPSAALGENTTFFFSRPDEKKSSWVANIMRGLVYIRTHKKQTLNIQTPFINAVHEGTEFLVKVDSQQTEITVFDGRVAATNQMGEIHIEKGFTGIATRNQPPRIQKLMIRPQDAVQWTLYYPPIIDYQTIDASADSTLQPALNAYLQDKPFQALTLLNAIPAEQQNSDYLTLKASLLLMFGSVEEALFLIDQSLLLEQDNSSALALQAIIAVTKNQQDKALVLAQKAVTNDAQSSVAQIALSYAHQSLFNIDAALIATQQAVRLSPNNALAWSRLSELQLSTGERSEALKSAQKAISLNPKLGRTQTILGFANLAKVNINQAKIAFTRAINLDSADPLAYLGLGLAKIRKGAIDEGSQDIEIAVSLDPDNAILRSYLGKAYYELRNDDYAAIELELAKEMDPKDPTAWFYDAIRKQTTNRPVEALNDMQKAIELNDNRGVYRSKLLLDEDLASRSASLGRIYNDLGFQQLGLVEGWSSVTRDPGNHSAHRLLADNYAFLPRQEIARVSELLQSQLLQPINMTTILPSLAESNLLPQNGLGPSSTSFNEFNPLFSKDRFNLQVSGIYGGNDTWGDEVVHSGLWEQFSYSLGQFHYETNGFRENNRLETDVYNIFAQVELPFNTNIQFEYRDNQTKTGDLTLKFDRDDFSKNLTQSVDTQTARFGVHYKLNSKHDFIGSAIYSDRQTHEKDSSKIEGFDGFTTTIVSTDTDALIDNESYSIELQSLHRFVHSTFILGLGHYKQNETLRRTNKLVTDITNIFFSIHNETVTPSTKDRDAKYNNAYIYSRFFLRKNLVATFGLSFDSFDSKSLGKFEKINPKFGLEWDVTPNTTFRTAYLETMKRPLAANQSIEPVHVAGFTQPYDDLNGAHTALYGFALDHTISPEIYFGAELKWRDIKTPVRDSPKKGQHEQLHRAYIYLTLFDNLALNFEYNYERINRDLLMPSELLATRLITHRVPLGLSYFLPNGLFTKISATYYNQNVEKPNSQLQGTDNFWILDTEIGYRLPNRWGILKIGIQNALNDKSHFESFNFPTGTVNKPSLLFSPERVFFTNFTFSFN